VGGSVDFGADTGFGQGLGPAKFHDRQYADYQVHVNMSQTLVLRLVTDRA
jgi:hypothetical protein